MPRDTFGTIVEIIFYILLVWLIIQIIQKLTGNSPSIEAILTTGLAVIISYLLIATYNIGTFIGKVNEFMENSKGSFKEISKDMNKVKRKLKL